MNNTNWKSLLRQISSILLLLAIVVQIIVVILLEADVKEDEIEEIHEITGFILMGLMLVHIMVYWKSLKTLFKFKNN
jgi:uncharacterized membrane protein